MRTLAGIAFLLLLAAPASARGEAPRPASVTIAGGVSLGAYEAGVAYYAVEMLRANAGMTELKLATGASAGSVNSLLLLLQVCGAPVPDPRRSVFWKAWIPLGLSGLAGSGKASPTAAFSRAAFEAPLALIREAWAAGLRSDCDVVFGLSVTRLTPRPVSLKGERLQLPRVEEHFVVRIRGRGPGRPPLLTNYADPTWEGEQALLPEGRGGEIAFPALVDALFASTAFPGAFPPQPIRHCIVAGGAGPWAGCPEASARSDLFVDGGVFDNTPIRLATQVAAAGLRGSAGSEHWIEKPDLRKREVRETMNFAYLSTDVSTFPPAAEGAAGKDPTSILEVAARVGGSFLGSARAKNLLYLHDQDPEFFERLVLAERHLPAASSPMGAFFGFFETSLREFDFTLGMYDARDLGQARLAPRLASGGAGGELRLPEAAPGAADAAGSWQPYRCLQAVLDHPEAAGELCLGETLRDFRIVLQTSLERLWDRCAALGADENAFIADPRCRAAAEGKPPLRVPGVEPLPGETWRRAKDETETAYTMRLLAAHQLHFEDLGLGRDQADQAPARLREQLLAVGHQVASSQPGGQGAIVEAAVKVGADQVTYVPPRNTAWVLFGRDLEAGASKGFTVERRLIGAVRLHGAFQVNNTATVLSSEHGSPAVSLLAGVEVLPASMASSTFQPSLIVRGGVLLSAKDDFWFGSCPHPESTEVGSCSRPALGVGVAATALERVRLQLFWNYYFRVQTGNVAWWAISPGIGLQWPF